ncbi:MAG: insulinase family protein [Alphaproteobacteria bacterium]|nr:insulinase family protein [Alphaproteobacteria bacterium]
MIGSVILALAVGAQAAELSIPHERYTLDNGLEVVLARDTSTPIVHVQVWYHVGSKDEQAGLTGFAHLFEHLMFNGSLNAPGDYFGPLQAVGADLNGTTNTDRTNYFETVPSRYLPLALFMESDRMGHLLEVLDQTKLTNQQGVVRNERRQRYENVPYGEAWVTLGEHLYPEGHPYRHPTIGSHEDLERARLEDVKDFFRAWYLPNNASLVVTGDFEPVQAKALIEENFGWIPRGAQPPARTAAPVVLSASDEVVEHDDVPDRKVWLAWHSAPLFAPGDAELDVVASLLCNGPDSRLYEALVRTSRVARDVGCYQASRQLGSVFVVSATASKGHTTAEVVAGIDAVLADLRAEAAPTAEEVAGAIADYEVGFLQRLQTISGRAGQISTYLHHLGKADAVQTDLERYTALTPDAVHAVAREVLGAERVVLHILPTADAPAEGGE